MTKQRKYENWHIILKVSKEYQKEHPEIKKGLCITNQFTRHNESINLINLKTGKHYDCAYIIDYIGRLPTGLSQDERWEKVKELADKYKEVN